MSENTIYYKEAPESPESLKALLLDYFEKGSPATYDSVTNEYQCSANCNRSIDDLILLANHYFPGSTVKDVLKVYQELNRDYQRVVGDKYKCPFIFFVCGGIEKPVLLSTKWTGSKNNPSLNIGNDLIFLNHTIYNTRNSQYTLTQLNEILESE